MEVYLSVKWRCSHIIFPPEVFKYYVYNTKSHPVWKSSWLKENFSIYLESSVHRCFRIFESNEHCFLLVLCPTCPTSLLAVKSRGTVWVTFHTSVWQQWKRLGMDELKSEGLGQVDCSEYDSKRSGFSVCQMSNDRPRHTHTRLSED